MSGRARRKPASKPGSAPRNSPLYTGPSSELAKRQVIAAQGRDADGAYRAAGRIDTPKTGRR